MSEPPEDNAPATGSEDVTERLDGKEQTRAFLKEMSAVGPVVGLMAALCLTLPALVGFFVIGSVLVDDGGIRDWLAGYGYWLAVIGFGLGFAVLSGSAIAPTYALSFACGVLFGPVVLAEGETAAWAEASYGARVIGCGLAAMIGVGLGSVIGYGWGALFARSKVMSVIEGNERARVIRDGIRGRGELSMTWLVGLIRFPPNSPFALTNLVLSAVHVKLIPYAIGTILGIAPRTLLAVFLGVQAGSFSAMEGKGKWFVLGSTVVAVAVFLLIYRVLSGWVREALSAELSSEPRDIQAD